jgi:AcrR family transcriptional regulator
MSATSSGIATEQRIREVATMLFYEKGYHGTTMRDIAAGVGIKAGSLYNHYESKQDLLFQISLETVREVHDGAVQRLEGIDDVEERFHAYIVWHVEFHARNRYAARVADEQLHALTKENREQVVALRDALEGLLKGTLSEGVKKKAWKIEEPSVIAIAIATMCTQVDAWYREGGRLDPEQIGEIYSRFLLAGLKGGGAA